MTGGACQPDGQTTAGLSANPLTNMMEQMIMGDARARQATEGYVNPAQVQIAADMTMMQTKFENMQAQKMMQHDSIQIQHLLLEVLLSLSKTFKD